MMPLYNEKIEMPNSQFGLFLWHTKRREAPQAIASRRLRDKASSSMAESYAGRAAAICRSNKIPSCPSSPISLKPTFL